MPLHLVKLCVGVADLDQLTAWQDMKSFPNPINDPDGGPVVRHITRNTPRRGEEVLNGGSLYWVIKGVIQARNTIVGFEEIIGEDGKKRCGLLLATPFVETVPTRHRPIQGWRYYEDAAAPDDLGGGIAKGDKLPAELAADLKNMGLI
jgi:hypothetical protein